MKTNMHKPVPKNKIITILVLMVLSVTSYTQSPEVWYANAQQRIDTLRKGHFGVKILNKDGQPVTGKVSVRMVRHEFPFGIAFDFYEGDIKTSIPTEEQWIKATMLKYFNYGVSGNSFKWSGIQPQHTAPNYTAFDNAVSWTQKVGWELRAHTLLWGAYNYEDDHPLPRWVKDLPTPQAITDTCKMRVIREVTRYKGIVKEYDVINEPLHATYLQSVVGDSINWNCFKWARSADSTAELFVNDYNVEYVWGDAKKYRDLILKIKENGGPVTGVGMQCHFWNGLRPNISDFITQINTVAEAGLPIKFTEFDYGGDLTQAQQAEDLVKVFKIGFSHPSVNGIICWGLCDKNIWRENTGLFDKNHKPKLAADTLLYLTKKLWSTNFDSTLAGEQPLMFNAYYGYYNLEVTFNDTVKVFTIPCIKANDDSVFTLSENDAVLKGPQLIQTELLSNTQVKMVFDKTIDNASIDKYNFRFFSNNSIAISSMEVNPEEMNIITITLNKQIVPGDYISVSYFPGTLASTDGSKASAFGPEPIKNPLINNVKNMLRDNNITIYPVPAENFITINGLAKSCKVSIFNVAGILLFENITDSESMKINVSEFKKGFYVIKITDMDNHFVIRKILLK
jgi:GH35 family endo-1,4-beta-xylanase